MGGLRGIICDLRGEMVRPSEVGKSQVFQWSGSRNTRKKSPKGRFALRPGGRCLGQIV
jgi:hypothetical protein